MPAFGSEDFIKEFESRVNSNKTYEDAAKGWEGDFLFIIKPEGPLAHEVVYYVDLYHGKCRGTKLLASRDEMKTKFIYEGPLSSWVRLFAGQLDPIGSLMMGKFKLHGSLVTILRYTRAAKELVNSVATVPIEYPADWSEYLQELK